MNNFINDGPFFEKYPDIYDKVTRYEHRDEKDNLIESWERGKDGRMHDVTARDKAREELIAAQEALERLERLEDKYND